MNHLTPKPEAYVLDEQVGFLLRLASQRHSSIFQRNVVLDLTPTQFSALVRLFELGEVSQNELGRRVAMDIATTKGVVDRLKDKGLIRARPDPTDKRRALLSVEPAHAGLIDELHKTGHDITARTLEPLSKSEAARLVQLLQKLT